MCDDATDIVARMPHAVEPVHKWWSTTHCRWDLCLCSQDRQVTIQPQLMLWNTTHRRARCLSTCSGDATIRRTGKQLSDWRAATGSASSHLRTAGKSPGLAGVHPATTHVVCPDALLSHEAFVHMQWRCQPTACCCGSPPTHSHMTVETQRRRQTLS